MDQFSKSPRENIQLYTGDFLQGFFLKDAESYEYWIVKMRNYYKEKSLPSAIKRSKRTSRTSTMTTWRTRSSA